MKGCLKQPSPTPSPGPECANARKCVAFEADGSEQVFFADEWDRTPIEPTRKLSYQDLMELKEIQRSLPLANQPPDPILGRPGRQYLSTVPIGLLPLLPQADAAGATQPPLRTTPHVSPTNYNLGLTSLLLQRHITSTSRSPSNHHLPPSNAKISNPMAQHNFAFLPLLDTPASSDTTPLLSNPSSRSASPDLPSDTDQSLDPPTPSLTNASLDSSPMSRASSGSPEPTFLQLPPRHLSCGVERYYNNRFGPRDSYFPDMDDDHSEHVVSHRPGIDSSSFHPEKSIHSCDDARPVKPVEPPKPARKRNIIFVNDVEIELDDDEEDEESTPAPAPATPRSPDDLDLKLPKLSSYPTRNPSCTKNLKPPETGTRAETNAPYSTTSDHLIQPANNQDGGFGLYMPLRFKRRLPSIDNSSDFIYTGRS